MDKFLLTGWLVVLVAAVCTEAAPQFQHLYLGYVSPFEFLQGLRNNVEQYAYQPYRHRRSAMGATGYNNYHPTTHHNTDYHPTAHQNTGYHQNAMPYSPSFGYNPMTYPYKMFSFPTMKFPAMPKFPSMHKFPEMKFPSMPDLHFPSFNMHHPIMPSSNFFNSVGYKPYQPSAPAPHHPFGDNFMQMMGFHGSSHHAKPNNNNYNNHNNYNNYNNNMGNHDNYNYNKPGGKNYEMSYSNSYSMNMDLNNGKGHMVTKDSSYMNDNGKVYQHNNPEQHYTSYGNGKFMPDKSYNHH